MRLWFETEGLESGLWALAEPHAESVNSYVLLGSEGALLVDRGLAIGDIREAISGLTSLPVQVVNTHGHYDHIGGNHLFGGVAVHRDGRARVEAGACREELDIVADPGAFMAAAPSGFDPETFHIPGARVLRELDEGDVIELGDRQLTVVHTPGHSPGTISLHDQANGLLFVGGVIYRGNLFACLLESDFRACGESARRLSELSGEVRLVLPGHGPGRRGSSPWGQVVVYQGPGLNILLYEG